jgi:hypothetical protein
MATVSFYAAPRAQRRLHRLEKREYGRSFYKGTAGRFWRTILSDLVKRAKPVSPRSGSWVAFFRNGLPLPLRTAEFDLPEPFATNGPASKLDYRRRLERAHHSLLAISARCRASESVARLPTRRRFNIGTCPICGYDVTGNPTGVSPECAEPVNRRANA